MRGGTGGRIGSGPRRWHGGRVVGGTLRGLDRSETGRLRGGKQRDH